MHIADGVLPGATLLVGGVVALGVGAWSLRAVLEEDAPKVALVTAACFCASHLSFPIGPTSVHLLLSGLAGVVLGRAGFIAAAVAVLLQTALFQHGGLTTLGVNMTTIGSAALVAGVIFDRRGPAPDGAARPGRDARWAGAAAAAGTLVALLLYGAALWTGGEALALVWKVAVAWNLVLVPIEALVCASTIRFLARVEPRLVRPPRGVVRAAVLSGVAGLLILTAAAPAQAHRLDLDVVAHPDGRVAGEVFFSDGRALRGGKVEVRRAGVEAPLATATTDAKGAFLVRVLPTARGGEAAGRVLLEVVVTDGAGHRAVARCPVTWVIGPSVSSLAAGERGAQKTQGGGARGASSASSGGKDGWRRLVLGLGVIATLGFLLARAKKRRQRRPAEPGA